MKKLFSVLMLSLCFVLVGCDFPQKEVSVEDEEVVSVENLEEVMDNEVEILLEEEAAADVQLDELESLEF
ncbi:hypothetical protein KAI58_03925 [Candidatus Gracilibacteria bacterium]|nr:hypothetical protein [Candidatus Gracilibacteria bacterium]